MVPGVKTKNRKVSSLQLDYLIYIQEIKPWPPSQSLRTLRAVLIQWEHGDRNSGSTSQVIPSLGTGSGVGDGRIEFNESFRLPVTLSRELSGKSGGGDIFRKNCIEFHLFEPRRDKTVKGQLLGTAVVDLADYGIFKDTLSVTAAINCKRTYRNTIQPILFLKISSVDKGRTRDLSTRASSIEKNGVDSVSALMSEEYAEEAENVSVSDDDVSSHSSLAISSSPVGPNGVSLSHNKVNVLESFKVSSGDPEDVPASIIKDFSKSDEKHFTVSNANSKSSSSRSSSSDLSSDLAWIAKNSGSGTVPFSSSAPCEVTDKEDEHERIFSLCDETPDDIGEGVLPRVRCNSTDSSGLSVSAAPPKKEASDVSSVEKMDLVNSFYSSIKGSSDDDCMTPRTEEVYPASTSDLTENGHSSDHKIGKYHENGERRGTMEERGQCIEDPPGISFSQDEARMDNSFGGSSVTPDTYHCEKNDIHKSDRVRHVRSVRSTVNSISSELIRTSHSVPKDMQNGAQGSLKSDRKDNKMHLKNARNILLDSKFQQLEQRVNKLEWELTEAAAIEVGLYSIVAEHGSSANKVHAPARRLSRFYLHAPKVNSESGRARAAKSAVSGLILITKACGNDVPRLTFWLSNSILLRAIIGESLEGEQLPFSVHPHTGRKGSGNGNKKVSPLKWQCMSTQGLKSPLPGSFDDWDNPKTLLTALEKVEAWTFSRIIESIWWQTFTPHMQSGAAKAINVDISSDPIRTMSDSGELEQGTFSLELWKKAFRDAYERICPVRAEGHECGCLPMLSRLVMEQCVARLDVAMFNAILRESADDIPSDPVSDPISDAKVLPMPSGKASFGAGAQLKNAIGNWSRWLTDLFGLDDDSSYEDMNTDENSDDDGDRHGASMKSFHLLNALSDLMMLPKDMLLSRTVRKEVCPTFGPALIRRVLNIFVPDEFCPDPIPKVVFEALNSEDSFEAEENTVLNFPCPAAEISYVPPQAAYIIGIMGASRSHSKLTRSGSSLLAKSYTSDDELEALDSPLSCIFTDSIHDSPSMIPTTISDENASHNAMRYQLLRKIWMCNG